MSMFGTPKPTASLSSGLLARKGHARPAMRPQGFVSHLPPSAEDLGWNDMGDDFTPAPQPVAPQVPPVVRQREALEEQLAPEPAPFVAPEPVPVPQPVAKAPIAQPPIAQPSVARVVREAQTASRSKAEKSKAAFTLRLDNDRHLRLRLASAVTNRSAQHLVTEALDAFLESLTEVDALATQLDSRKSSR
ncbi:hypothetical protein P1X14_03875 [Sphingomonas sp. AOB5]|uniref:hypothetical protein n=1 Tax=Sphingomonas sp. AOB5 TaxID=3034017 RepID=UPI0023F8A9B9|nr:hypothetical protein [Sphingomonas sp. AOB5]MDF7774374.1 hypothetical protein [Sphingomonas sp. AOB5]